MKKVLIYFAYFCILSLFISPVLAENWIKIPNANIDYDSDSIKNEGNNIYTVQTKSPTKDELELIGTLVINCTTKRFNSSKYKLYNPIKQKYVYQQYLEPDWTDIPKNSNIDYLYRTICN